MRSTMTTTKARPAQVLASEVTSAPDAVRPELGRRETLKSDMRRWKRGAQPPEPATRADIDVPTDYKQTRSSNPQTFLIHDSGASADKRMLVFASLPINRYNFLTIVCILADKISPNYNNSDDY